MPKLSVIVAFDVTEPHLRHCLDSLAGQDAGGRGVEIVLVPVAAGQAAEQETGRPGGKDAAADAGGQDDAVDNGSAEEEGPEAAEPEEGTEAEADGGADSEAVGTARAEGLITAREFTADPPA